MAYDIGCSENVVKMKGSSDGIERERELLIEGRRPQKDYSLMAAILPFLFPALGGLLFGYDIGATSGATISLEGRNLERSLQGLKLSFGPIGWLMISEIFPLRLRGRGLSIAVLVNFGTNSLVTFAFSPLQDILGAGILFVIFGVISLIALVFIFFVVPETKGLSLEEIEDKIL